MVAGVGRSWWACSVEEVTVIANGGKIRRLRDNIYPVVLACVSAGVASLSVILMHMPIQYQQISQINIYSRPQRRNLMIQIRSPKAILWRLLMSSHETFLQQTIWTRVYSTMTLLTCFATSTLIWMCLPCRSLPQAQAGRRMGQVWASTKRLRSQERGFPFQNWM